jgi:acyl-coenzyme A synthetase/AMP-(fatty) acid ligase
MKERVASYKVPRAVVWRDALPRNSMGKVQKARLLTELSAQAEAPTPDER